MKAFGIQLAEGFDVAVALCEVTISANPAQLREISRFLLHCASEIEGEDAMGHYHLRDNWEAWLEEFPDLIVFGEN